MTVKQVIEDNLLKIITGSIGALSIILGAAFTIDSRYVHAGDLAELKKEHSRAIQQQTVDNQVSVNELRKQMLEDKIFEIQLIPPQKRSDADRARLDKYTRDLDGISKRNIEILRSVK
jgi:hypothetical protein